jgi:hypothetical protein
LYAAGDAIDELFQAVRSAQDQESAPVAIGIEIHGGVLAQFVGMGFGPFGRPQQHRFLAVPRAVNDCPARLPALLQQIAEGTRFFEQRHLPGDGIFGTIYPGIVMIATNNPFISGGGAGNFGNNVVNFFDVPIRFHFEVDLSWARSHVVGDGQRTAPLWRRHRSFEGG